MKLQLKEAVQQLMIYIDTKNSHGRNELKTKLQELHLQKSSIYQWVDTDAPTSIGKNQFKEQFLQSMIDKISDNIYITTKDK